MLTLKGGKESPEKLIRQFLRWLPYQEILSLTTISGSGTTCAVAHKIGRRYIGIEQLEYGDDDSTARLTTVIDGDTTGISKAVKWKGGGSFVSCM